MSRNKDIEAVYMLSPMQQGMLFHSLDAPDSGVYVEQSTCVLRGRLDVETFRAAWQHALDAHPILRTAFVWKKLEKPLQAVHRRLELPFEFEDWRGLSESERRDRLEVLLAEDRRRGFELAKAPLMRLKLFRITEEAYRFVWTHHHLLLDGWSLPLLMKQVCDSYENLLAGRPAAAAAARPFAEYIAWLKRQNLSDAEAYWRRALAGFTAPTPLVFERSKTGGAPVKEYAEAELRLPAESTSRVREFARQNRITMNTVVQGAWALLLGRYTGESDVVFGATVSGRPADLPGSDSMIGLFINTLPVRAHIQPDQPAGAWLAGMQASQLEMRQFEWSPLLDVQGWSEIPRGTPLFESILVFENYPFDAAVRARKGSFEVTEATAFERTNYPLTLVSGPGRELMLKACYDRGRFASSAIRRLLEHLRTLIEAMPAAVRLRDLQVLSSAERRKLTSDWARNPGERRSTNVVAEFEAQVERTPEAPAVCCEGQELSYAELNARADRLARYLRTLGVGRESLAAVWLDRGLDLVVAELAVLKAGGAFVPLDPAYPVERLQFMLEDSGARVLITDAVLRGHIPSYQGEILQAGDSPSQKLPPITHHPSPTDLAYVIYTSGSTGRPKGTLLHHAGLMNYLGELKRLMDLGPGTRLLQFASPSFDVSVSDIFGALISGATVVIPTRETATSPVELADFIRREKITAMLAPPSLLRVLPNGDMPDLRVVASGAELCTPEVVEKWAPGRTIFLNGYGPTEASIGPCWHRLEPGEPAYIGRPIANTEAYVLDRNFEPVPVGIPGELFLGGVCVARGYLNQPGLTAEKFLPHPFSTEPGARLYRTGDLVRWSEEGALDYLGRLDEQVKLRGFRIELGEIESVLREHPAVAEAVVVAQEERLVAYVVGETAGLREHLQTRLPEYMVPGAVVKLESLPRLPNGKVDRRGLPSPEESVPGVGAHALPRTPVEEMLCEIWRQVLKRERVGIHDNFFELGGHSLLATQLLGRLQEPMGVEIPLRALFEQPTIAGLAAVVEGRRGGVKAPPIRRVERGGPLPLSFAQQRLWFLEQLEPGSALYNNPLAVRLKGKLDVGRLEGALNQLIARHEVLRTRFVNVEGQPAQVIEAEMRVAVAVEEAGDIRAQAEAEGRQPFDLERGPLVRARLLRVSEEEHVAVVTLHHIISDGWSLGVVVRELSALYAGEVLAPLEVQYADYAVWQREWLRGEVLEEQLGYWREQLEGAPPVLELAADRVRPAVQSHRGGHYRFRVGAGTAGALRELSRREGVTLFMVVLAGWAVVLSRWAGGEEEVLVGTPVANRKGAEVEGLIGFFVNTLVLRTRVAGDPTVRELLGQVREVCLGAYGRQEAPFEMVVEGLGVERELSHAPLFQVMLVWNNAPEERWELGGLVVEGMETESGRARFDLTLEMGEAGEELWGSLEYARDLWEEETAGRLAGSLVRVLEQMRGEKRVSELEWVSVEEARQVEEEWNATECDYPRGTTVQALFEAEARAHPERVALRFEGREVTYGELDGWANEWAGRIERGQLVGIERERSLEQVVEQLAVLKAGGAYVPIDPGYPEERRRYMREDSGAGREQVEGLAYVIYTSGTTGRPKGTEVGHEGLCNLVRWQKEMFGIGEGSRVLQFAPASFDASVWETWMALGNGGRLVLGRQEEMGSMEGLHGLLEREGITVVTLPPAVLGLLSAEGLPELRVVIAAGEVCGGELVEKWGRGRRFFNAYGPTEATVCATAHECRMGEGAPPIGRPIGNTRVYIVDGRGKPVPVGVWGEIWIGGVGVARGYRKRGELTAEKFVETKWGRVYRTGDVGRWRRDGEIEYLGRKDGQVKVRGYRIELGEVEEALRGCAGVREAAAAVKGGRLIGYVVGGEAGEVRGQLRERLPEYMTPQAIVRLEKLPVMANGKVDRKGLPEGERREYQGPRTEVEEKLAEMCGELLQVERVGVEESFFEMGGHSLLATQLVSRIREVLGVEVPLRAIFETPTVAGLAARIEERRAAAQSDAVRIAALLERIETMSEEEARVLLEGKHTMAWAAKAHD